MQEADQNVGALSQKVRIGRWSVPLPRNRFVRMGFGMLLVIGGILSFLPILGVWMIPLGLAVLAADFPFARRLNRRLLVGGRKWFDTVRMWFGYQPSQKRLRKNANGA